MAAVAVEVPATIVLGRYEPLACVVWRATVSAPEKEPPPRQRDTLLMDTAELAEALNAKATCELVPKMLAVWSGEEAQAVSMNRRGTLPGVLTIEVAVAAEEVVPVCDEVRVGGAVPVLERVGGREGKALGEGSAVGEPLRGAQRATLRIRWLFVSATKIVAPSAVTATP